MLIDRTQMKVEMNHLSKKEFFKLGGSMMTFLEFCNVAGEI